MTQALLKRLSLTCTIALCAQPLWGMESTNPDMIEDQTTINRPQTYGQQQIPAPFAPQPNMYPWMDQVPQNAVIHLAPMKKEG